MVYKGRNSSIEQSQRSHNTSTIKPLYSQGFKYLSSWWKSDTPPEKTRLTTRQFINITFIIPMNTSNKSDSQLPNNRPPQKNLLPWWFIRLLLIASLVMPPTLVAAFSKDPVFLHFKLWNIEYQFQKGNITLPEKQQFEQKQLEAGNEVDKQWFE